MSSIVLTGYLVATVTRVGTIGGAVGTMVSICGTRSLVHLSQFFANKEAHCEQGTATAYKIAKWATLAFAGVAGTAGALLTGFSVFMLISVLTLPVTLIAAETLGIVGGVISVVALESYVIKKLVEQNVLYKSPIN